MNDQERHGVVRRKSFDHPDEQRRFPNGIGVLVNLGSIEVGRAVLKPGWRWSNDVKPAVGTASCEMHHLHVVISGRLGIETDAGETHEFEPNDVVDIPPGHDAWVVGDEPVVLLDFSGNVADYALPISATRAVATMLMTDIVGSTTIATRLGDAVWKQRLAEHNRVVRRQLERFGGREINTTGDGFLAIFNSAGAALRCAVAARDATSNIGIDIRAGVHSGEIEIMEDDVRGLAVHATARVMSSAAPAEILASSITCTLAGSVGLRFEDRGSHRLRGLESPLLLLAVNPKPT